MQVRTDGVEVDLQKHGQIRQRQQFRDSMEERGLKKRRQWCRRLGRFTLRNTRGLAANGHFSPDLLHIRVHDTRCVVQCNPFVYLSDETRRGGGYATRYP
jgi:hypothetical protein